MFELAIIWDWALFAVRWIHVITAIAWIGSSFYFVALDLGLRKSPDLPAGAHGEEWQVHGGGFYHIQKYLVAPDRLPEHLTWFKWESYATWLSGFVLLVMIYYVSADLYLVDPSTLELSAWQAILLSLGSIGLGWVLYDRLCKSPLGTSDTGLMLVLFCILVAMAWGYGQVFSGRAAFLHLGAFTATIMSANVFFIIIPNQKIVVEDLKAGRTPAPALGQQAKQRSLHNNYLTLPVLFLMLSNHYPLAFATAYSWLIASLVFLIGVLVRHYFNSRHAGTGNPSWTWLVAAILFLVIAWLSTSPGAVQPPEEVRLTPRQQQFAAAANFSRVRDTVQGRCAMCHAREPYYEGIVAPPNGVVLETDHDIVRHAREIYLHAGRSKAMPPANVSGIEPDERRLIVDWYRSAGG